MVRCLVAWRGLLVSTLASLGLIAALAHAQEPIPAPGEEGALPPREELRFDYKFDVVPESINGDTPAAKRTLAELKRTVSDVLRGNAELGANQPTFDNFFKRYMFARMTGPDDVPYLPERRRELLKIFAIIKTPQMRDYLNKLTLAEMLRIAGDTYHPAARYNAILIIGELNDADAVLFGAEKAAPDPMREALKPLVGVLTNPKLPDGIKVAALIGIQRHIELDQLRPEGRRLPPPDRAALVERLLEVATSPVPAGTPFAEGKFWVKRQAVTMLGTLGSVGTENKVLKALDALVGDPTAPVSLRCAAAVALGELNYPPNPGIDVKAVAGKITSIALVACQQELVRLKERAELEKARQEKAGFVAGGPGVGEGGVRQPGIPAPGGLVGGEGVVPKDDPTLLTRRRLRTEIHSVYTGLVGRTADKGIFALAKNPDDQKAVSKFVESIRGLLLALEGSETDLDSLRIDVLNKATALEALLVAVVKPATPAPAGTGPAAPADPTDIP